MDILVIGNGFDLAHKLPTKYSDFLLWIVGEYNYFYMLKEEKAQIVNSIESISLKIPDGMKGTIISQRVNNYQGEIWKCIDDNIWFEYFISIYKDRERTGKDGWIDFESEISKVIQSLDNDMHGLNIDYSLDDNILNLSNDYLLEKFSKYIFAPISVDESPDCYDKEITFREIRDRLLDDLNKLIRVLEIYLCEFVEKIKIQKKSPDIKELSIDYILSFNYTHIFSKLYEVSAISKQQVENPVAYIHGETNVSNDIDLNNMVLGIDEYLPKDRKDKDIEFIAFKKYYQRIYKGTGCKYKKWLDIIRKDYIEYMQKQMKTDNERYIPDKMQSTMYRVAMQAIKRQPLKKHNLYIFGHSLDITDGDILRDLILNDNVHTTIYYPDKDELGRKIANLVKVIGQDELIRRTGGSTKTIEFKLQQDMVEIK